MPGDPGPGPGSGLDWGRRWDQPSCARREQCVIVAAAVGDSSRACRANTGLVALGPAVLRAAEAVRHPRREGCVIVPAAVAPTGISEAASLSPPTYLSLSLQDLSRAPLKGPRSGCGVGCGRVSSSEVMTRGIAIRDP